MCLQEGRELSGSFMALGGDEHPVEGVSGIDEALSAAHDVFQTREVRGHLLDTGDVS